MKEKKRVACNQNYGRRNRGEGSGPLTFFKAEAWSITFAWVIPLTTMLHTISFSDIDTYISNIVWNLQVSHLCGD